MEDRVSEVDCYNSEIRAAASKGSGADEAYQIIISEASAGACRGREAAPGATVSSMTGGEITFCKLSVAGPSALP